MLFTKHKAKELINGVLISFLLFFTLPAYSAPDLQKVSTIDNVTIFADHQNKNTFYYLKNSKKLVTKDQAPDFHYSVNRYVGTEQTGDNNAFWVRGVIKFTTTSAFVNTGYQQILNQLRGSHGTQIVLKAAPVQDSYNRLVYATIEQGGGEGFSGELDGGNATETFIEGENEPKGKIFGSKEQRYTIGLSGNDANLFWENFERNNLILSLAYGWTVKGLILDQNDEWVGSSYAVNNTLPIQVSSEQYPQLFTKNELWQQIRFTHSNLTVMCYDFINLEETDLYYVNVEVRFKTLRDQYYSEQVKFLADGNQYEKTVSFQLANDIKDGYEYRVRRLNNEGELTRSDWLHNDTSWLDVSLSGAELTSHELITEEDYLSE